MPSNLEVTTPKSVTCTICQKKFSRTDHLKRHQLRHSGVKPYSCIFCHDSFTRSDNLRDHYPNCSERRNRPIPEAARGGRRSHACDTCTSMKLGCDGSTPCKTCRHKGLDCKYSRLHSKGLAVRTERTATPKSGQESAGTPPSDRGSIKFLLNSGTASFIECFRFPSSNERRNISNFRNMQDGSSDYNALHFFGNGSENGSTFSDPFEDEPIDWSLFQDENLLRFLSSPFTEVQMQADDIFAPMFMDPNFSNTAPVSSITFPGEWEPANVQSAAIVQALVEKSTLLGLNPRERTDISQHLNYLFTPSKIEKLISHYFEFWHPHCGIIHQPSFNIETAPIPLLVSMSLMGVMYSQVDHEVNSAKVVLDLAEMFVYSQPDLTEEFEIQQMLRSSLSSSPDQTPLMSLLAFQNLQAAYLMVCVQFWAGNSVARKRSIETRFSVIVKIARRLGLTKAQHELDDSLEEYSWIQKESQIRLINIMTLLDCAFSFFSNFPCRLTVTEMKFDLPCEDLLFASNNPFSEPTFKASRRLTTYEAFKSLFLQDKPSPPTTQSKKANPLGLNPMDMFILIHLLYVYTHSQITLFSSSIPRSPGASGTSSPAAAATTPPSDSNMATIKGALSRWRVLWTAIRASIPSSAWASLGFFRNGYNYWLVTQLLINNKGSVDVMMGMEVNCEDTLKQLKGLLKDGGADT